MFFKSGGGGGGGDIKSYSGHIDISTIFTKNKSRIVVTYAQT